MLRAVYFHSKEGKGHRQLSPFKKVRGIHIRLCLHPHLCIPAVQWSNSHFRLLRRVGQQVTGYTQMFCVNSHKLLVKSHLFLYLISLSHLSVACFFLRSSLRSLILLLKPGWSKLLPFGCSGCPVHRPFEARSTCPAS